MFTSFEKHFNALQENIRYEINQNGSYKGHGTVKDAINSMSNFELLEALVHTEWQKEIDEINEGQQ